MDSTRLTSPPSILVHDQNGNHRRRRSSGRSTGMPFISRSPGPMAIPNTRNDLPPPPLPPPRNIDDLAAGSDPGWNWGNDPRGGFGRGRESSAAESKFPKSWSSEMGSEDRKVQLPQRTEPKRREDSHSRIKSPTDAERRHHDFSRHQDEGYYSLSGPRPSAMSQQLHGERQLQQRNTENSSQAYDNKLLSKIGKPITPPRTSTIGSLESSPTSSVFYHPSGRHPNQLRSLSFPDSSNSIYSTSAYSDTPIKQEPGYEDNPLSRPISPTMINPSAPSAKSFMDYRSPTFERSTPVSASDSDHYPPYRERFPSSSTVLRQQKSRRSASGSLLSSYDESAGSSLSRTASITSERTSPLKHEKYDHGGFFPGSDSVDSTFPMEDSVRQLHLEDRVPSSHFFESSPSYHHPSKPSLHTSRLKMAIGQKRKQWSPPAPDLSHAPINAQLHAAAGGSTEAYRNTSPYPAQRLSPVHRLGPQQGSVSSQSSAGPRNNSYASSAGLSVGGSSMTSFDQHSPGTISPSSEQQTHLYQQQNGQDSPYVESLSMNQGLRNARQPQHYPQPPLEPPTDPLLDQKPQINQLQRRSNGPNMQSSAFICGCCPKKPKKFETEQELRNHESEKQYSCTFCTNRFKNKNEAERHQNSLHLRKHSWSCATLGGQYDSAFFPSTQLPPTDNTTGQAPPPPPPTAQAAAFDICGYCGEQFSNENQDWEARAQHLTNIHKFGECNQSKKFFRADHFRQHLKHSHAGTSGKWTNMLEQRCIKDEPVPTPLESSQSPGVPIANMGMTQPIPQAHMAQANMVSNSGQQGMGQAGMANMGQVNMGQTMNQSLGQQNIAQQAQQLAQMDMSNIDPNISGMAQLGNMAAMGNMGNMTGTPRSMNMQGGQIHNDRIEEMPQES